MTLRPIKKWKGQEVIALIFFCVGIFVILKSVGMPSGTYNTPGPGFYAGLLGIVFCVISLALGYIGLHHRGNTETVQLGNSNVWAAVFGLIGGAVLLERLGFILTFILFLVFLFKKFSNLRWSICALLAGCCSIGAYLFFNTLLEIRLPPIFIRW